MKISVLSIFFLVMLSGSVKGQMAVVDVTANSTLASLLAANTTNATSTGIMATIQSNQALMKKLSTIVTGMEAVRAYIEIANAVSCLMVDFEFYLNWADQSGNMNCFLDEQTNKILTQALMVMDMANVALNVILETDPANRIFLIRDSMRQFIDFQARLTVYTSHLSHKYTLINKMEAELEKREKLAILVRTY